MYRCEEDQSERKRSVVPHEIEKAATHCHTELEVEGGGDVGCSFGFLAGEDGVKSLCC